MRQDIERWDGKYTLRAAAPLPEHEPLLEEHAALLPVGDALDVACGLGQNVRWLAARGHRVLGVDGSVVGLRAAAAATRHAGLQARWLCADLDLYTPAETSFDVIVVTRFLYRPLIPRLLRSLRVGGVFFYRTFNVNRRREGNGFPGGYLLECGELHCLLEGLEVLAGNDTGHMAEPSSWLLARKPGKPA